MVSDPATSGLLLFIQPLQKKGNPNPLMVSNKEGGEATKYTMKEEKRLTW